MKIVVIGGSGLIGSKVVARLRAHGHEAIPASPDSGVTTLTGEGLVEVVAGASVVADAHVRYFGAELREHDLVPGGDAQLGEIQLEDWLSQTMAVSTS